MKRWLWLGLVIGLCATGIQAQPVEVTPLAGVVVTLNQTRLTFESPLVMVNKTVFIPLREVVRAVNGRTSYLRKDDAFQVQIPSMNTPVVVAPNSTEIWVGGTQGYFSKKTFFKDGQFYVPFEEFFRCLNYSVKSIGNDYVIRRGVSGSAIPIVAPKTPRGEKQKDPTVVLVTRPPDPKLDVDLPAIPSGQSLAIGFGAKIYTINGKFLMDKDTVYADLEAVLVKEGMPVIKRPDYVEVVSGRRTFRFFTQTADVRITSGNQTEVRGVGWPLDIRQGVPYFSIKALAAALNYGVSWDRGSRRIQLLNRIQQVAIIRRGDVLRAVISASHPVVALPPVALDHDGGFTVDLLDTQLGCPSGVIESDDPVVSRMEIRAISDTRVRIKIVLKPSVGYSPVLPSGTGGEIILSSRVTSVTERVEHNEWIVRVSGMGAFVPKVWRVPSPSTALVVDVPNSYSLLPMAIRPQGNGPYQMIRTSQFSLDPASTRIVLDMTSTLSYTVRPLNPSSFEIVFPYHPVEGAATSSMKTVTTPTRDLRATATAVVAAKPLTPSTSITHSTHREQVIRKTPSHRALSRKIIVIDPGHGGNDPGAIAVDGSYEKALTIDISNRLKTLLEEAGATVIMCRLHDENPSLQDRCDSANFNNADLLLSIHINSFFHPYASGTETYYYKPSDKPLAFYIHQEMTKTLGFRDNGLKRARLYVLRNTRMPAMLVEPGFITNPMEFGRMAQPDTRQKIAKAVADGTIRYMAEYGTK